MRFLKKKKIHLLWIINDLYTNNFITVYREARRRKDMKITLVASPHLAPYGFGGLSSEDVAAFLEKSGLKYLKASKGKIVDLKKLKPDYIFTTTPYDDYLPTEYQSDKLAGIGKLCTVMYGAVMADTRRMSRDLGYGYENPFLEKADLIFWPADLASPGGKKDRVAGYLKMDEHLHYGRKADAGHWQPGAELRLMWKPRWTLVKGDSRFEMVLDGLEGLLDHYPQLDVIMLEHPFLRDKIKDSENGEKWLAQLKRLESRGRFKTYNEPDFLDVLLSADVFMGGHSSSLAEFALTGRPIIYLKTEAVLNPLGELLASGAYEAESMEDIDATIGNLIADADPMAEKRKQITEWTYRPPEGVRVAKHILNILEEEYWKENI